MLNQRPIIVQPSIRPHHPPSEEYCTVVFRLQGGRSAMGGSSQNCPDISKIRALPRSSSSRSVITCLIDVN
jgi:hypothetical protein